MECYDLEFVEEDRYYELVLYLLYSLRRFTSVVSVRSLASGNLIEGWLEVTVGVRDKVRTVQ